MDGDAKLDPPEDKVADLQAKLDYERLVAMTAENEAARAIEAAESALAQWRDLAEALGEALFAVGDDLEHMVPWKAEDQVPKSLFLAAAALARLDKLRKGEG